MDKYEYNLKLDQMKSLSAEEHYAAAAEIADTINWSKIKNINAMVIAGEVYEKLQRYEESRDVLLLAYDRSPIGRTIVFRLAEVSIKMGDFSAAQQYYNEFVDVAPHDNLRYVLKYDMQKAQGADYSELIPILEELKESEYTEEWAYELAYLYHKAGMPDKCVDACDELILWFGDGPYVERALELKMIYQPLTKVQEEKYRRFRLEKQGITQISAEEMERAGEYIHEPVEIPEVELDVSTKFNTVNLQKEIAKGMQQIINATEKETVSDTIDNIKKIVEDIPYLTLPQEEEVELDIKTDKEIDGSLKVNFQEMLGEEEDGQMSLVTGDQGMVERQITGQMTIQEILDEWKKTQTAAQKALEKADQAKLESAKARALHEAEGIMERLTDVMPKLDAGMTPTEILREKYMEGVTPEMIEVMRKEQEAKAAQAVEDAKEAAREVGVVAEVVQVPKGEKKETEMEESGQEPFADPSEIPAVEITKRSPEVRPGISIEAVRDMNMGQPEELEPDPDLILQQERTDDEIAGFADRAVAELEAELAAMDQERERTRINRVEIPEESLMPPVEEPPVIPEVPRETVGRELHTAMEEQPEILEADRMPIPPAGQMTGGKMPEHREEMPLAEPKPARKPVMPEVPAAQQRVQRTEMPAAQQRVQRPEMPAAQQRVQRTEMPAAAQRVQRPEMPTAPERVQRPEVQAAQQRVQRPEPEKAQILPEIAPIEPELPHLSFPKDDLPQKEKAASRNANRNKKITRISIGPAASAKAKIEADADAVAHKLAADAAAARASMQTIPKAARVVQEGTDAAGDVAEAAAQVIRSAIGGNAKKAEEPVPKRESVHGEKELGVPGERTARMSADKIAAEIKTMFRPDEQEEVIPESGSDVVPDLSGESKKDRQRTKPIPTAKELKQALRKRQKEDTLLETIVPKEMLEYYDESTPKQEEHHLTEEQKAVFSYFVPVSGMENQLAEAIIKVGDHLRRNEAAFTGNLIIQGGHGCGKTVLATSMIRALQKETGRPNNKIGKIDADTLNKKDIQMLMRKVSGGCLIIEEAGGISRQSAVTLSLLMDQDQSGILVILEDTSKGIKRALAQDSGFAKKFTQKISVPIFTNDDLVAFAKSYSEELGYRIDELAVLALYNRISNIQRLDQATTLTEVKEIVDEAIDREARGGIQKFFSILTAKRYDEDDKIILQEKDFE